MTNAQKEVLKALSAFGHPATDAALVPFAQHGYGSQQSSSSIRSRRAELSRSGFVEPAGRVTMRSGRSATLWQLTPSGRAQVTKIKRDERKAVAA